MKNQQSSVVAETMKLKAHSSYGCQLMHSSRKTVAKYLKDENTQNAIDSNFSKKLNHLKDNLYEIKSVKADVEHKEPIIVGIFILQYAKLECLNCIGNFSKSFVI